MIKNPFKRYRIDYLLFGSFSCLIVILLVVSIVISYNFISRESVNNTSYYQQSLLNQLNKQIVTQMDAIEQISLATSRNVNLREFLDFNGDSYSNFQLNKTVSEYLANIVYSITSVESIDLFVNHPTVSNQGIPVNYKDFAAISKEEWFPLININDFTWIPENQTSINDNLVPVIPFIRKVYSYSGRYLGVIVFNIKASSIRNLMKGENNISEERPYTRAMMDFGGRILFTVGDYSIGSDMQEYIRSRIHNGEKNYIHAKLINSSNTELNDSLIVWSQFNSPNWMLIEITPWKQITAGSVKIAIYMVYIGIITIIMAIILTLILSKQFTKPIRILQREMKTFEKFFSTKSRNTHLPRDYDNEFGTMFRVYEIMLDRIEELYRSLERRYSKQKETEIQALQSMINPHFLYNTLDQINWMAIEAGHVKISNVLEMVGRMFRIGLSNGEYLIKIAEELEYIRCYMEIQAIRLGNKFDFIIEVSDTIKHYYILKLTLQPFLENAVLHGLHGIQHGQIVIRAIESKDGILFIISDNGQGMREDWQDYKQRETGGYGIRNVQERIDAYFSNKYGIRFESAPSKGTEVSIFLPKIEDLNTWREQNVESGNH